MEKQYRKVEEAFNCHMELGDDPDLARIMFATIIANKYDGNPVWLMIIGPAGCGKSEMLMALSGSDQVYTVSTLTPKALASGYGDGEESSLLFKLSGKILVIKDLSATSRQAFEQRQEVMGLLRDAYDGKLDKSTGRVDIHWEGKFGLIAGATPAIERDRSLEASLGERFLYIRSRITDTDAVMDKVIQSMSNKTKMRNDLKGAAASFMKNIVLPSSLKIDRDFILEVRNAARGLVLARSGIERESGTREIQSPVERGELAMRSFEQLMMMAKGLFALGTERDHVRRILMRIVFDSIPYARVRILQEIARGAKSVSKVSEETRMSRPYVGRTIEELTLLDVLKPNEGKSKGWTIEQPWLKEASLEE